jgi:chromosome segregation ATPase
MNKTINNESDIKLNAKNNNDDLGFEFDLGDFKIIVSDETQNRNRLIKANSLQQEWESIYEKICEADWNLCFLIKQMYELRDSKNLDEEIERLEREKEKILSGSLNKEKERLEKEADDISAKINELNEEGKNTEPLNEAVYNKIMEHQRLCGKLSAYSKLIDDYKTLASGGNPTGIIPFN